MAIYETNSEQVNRLTELTADEARNIAEVIERVDKFAHDLLALQGGDDPDQALAGALRFLLRAANVADDYADDSVHPRIVLEVLADKFGIESVRDWTRDCAKRSRRRLFRR